MLKLQNINKTFNEGTINEKKALIDINLHLNPQDFVTVIGGNGAGKMCIRDRYIIIYNKIQILDKVILSVCCNNVSLA